MIKAKDDWGKKLKMYNTCKRLFSLIFKTLLQIDNKESNNPLKNRDNINRQVTLNTFTELLLAKTPVRTGNNPYPYMGGSLGRR